MKKVLWIIMLAVVGCMAFMNHLLMDITCGGNGIVTLEFADRHCGLKILQCWQLTTYGDENLLAVAQRHTHWDFAFILLYVTLLIMHSNSQMQREKWMPFNELLRLNIFLTVLVGLLDIAENVILLHNFHHVFEPEFYWESHEVTLLKFILAGWIILIWFTSLVKSLFQLAVNQFTTKS